MPEELVNGVGIPAWLRHLVPLAVILVSASYFIIGLEAKVDQLALVNKMSIETVNIKIEQLNRNMNERFDLLARTLYNENNQEWDPPKKSYARRSVKNG